MLSVKYLPWLSDMCGYLRLHRRHDCWLSQGTNWHPTIAIPLVLVGMMTISAAGPWPTADIVILASALEVFVLVMSRLALTMDITTSMYV